MNLDFIRRDSKTKALINEDSEALKAYRIQRDRSNKLVLLERDINIMKCEIQEIKTLLKEILNRG